MSTCRNGMVGRAVGTLLATLGLITAIGAGAPVSAQDAGLKPVRDPQNRFTIDVPVGWSIQTQAKNPSVVAKAPATKTTLPDSLQVTVYDWSAPISAQACISESDIVLRYVIHTWTTVKEGPVTVAGQPGYSRVYNWTASGEPRQSVETCVTHGNRVYVVVGTTDNTPAKVTATMPLMLRSIATLQPNLTNLAAVTAPANPVGKK
ncbi:MAG TPA: hypothetical protein VJT33_02005 [bacterium]|nr:hypothetical protein [bacterium]